MRSSEQIKSRSVARGTIEFLTKTSVLIATVSIFICAGCKHSAPNSTVRDVSGANGSVHFRYGVMIGSTQSRPFMEELVNGKVTSVVNMEAVNDLADTGKILVYKCSDDVHKESAVQYEQDLEAGLTKIKKKFAIDTNVELVKRSPLFMPEGGSACSLVGKDSSDSNNPNAKYLLTTKDFLAVEEQLLPNTDPTTKRAWIYAGITAGLVIYAYIYGGVAQPYGKRAVAGVTGEWGGGSTIGNIKVILNYCLPGFLAVYTGTKTLISMFEHPENDDMKMFLSLLTGNTNNSNSEIDPELYQDFFLRFENAVYDL